VQASDTGQGVDQIAQITYLVIKIDVWLAVLVVAAVVVVLQAPGLMMLIGLLE
jgi:hypothetical protein